MGKKFTPPFQIEADFYDAKGDLLEHCEEWGDCPEATTVKHRVVDAMGRIVSTYKVRENAEKSLAKLLKDYK